jgi:RNA polymerase sigma factor for flagellar operon FliA
MGTTPAHTVHAAQPSQPAETDALIQEYAPFVKYVAQRLACRLPASVFLDDLISAGAIGLMDAIAKYDPTRGTTFKTYAELRIRGAMLDDLREGDWVPRSVRDKEHALTAAYAELERRHGRPADDEDVAALLGLDLDTFSDWLTQVRGVSLLSLDMPLELDANGFTSTALTLLVDEVPGPHQLTEAQELKSHLAEAIDQLPGQEKTVLSLYYYEELTMQEIGQVLEVTESRVSQIHTKAILHVRAALQHLTDDAYAPVGGPF